MSDHPAPVVFVPTRSQVEALQVGDLALDCFGRWSKVTEITARRDDIRGKLFVCFATEFGPNSTVTGSYKEDELVRTAHLTGHYNSAQCRELEAQHLRARGQ